MPITCRLVKIEGEWPSRAPTYRERLARCTDVVRHWRAFARSPIRELRNAVAFIKRRVHEDIEVTDPRITEIVDFGDMSTPKVVYRRPD